MCVMAICMHIPPVSTSMMSPKGSVAYMFLLNGSTCACVQFLFMGIVDSFLNDHGLMFLKQLMLRDMSMTIRL